MTKIQPYSSIAPLLRSAQGALALACAASLLVSACGDDGTSASPDAAPEVDPALLIPVAGLWRAALDGSPDLCKLGGAQSPLAQQKIGEFFPLEDGSLFTKDIVGQPSFTCSLSTPGIYGCVARVQTFESEGDTYTGTQNVSMEFTGTMAGTLKVQSTLVCSGTGCASTEPCVDDVTYTGTPFVETEVLTDLGCAEEATIKSGTGSTETYIDMVNNTGETLVRYWLDFEGNRAAFSPAVAPGDSFRQSTFAGHAWLFEGTSGCHGIFTASGDIGVVTLD